MPEYLNLHPYYGDKAGDVVSSADKKWKLIREVEPHKWEVEEVEGPPFHPVDAKLFEYERFSSTEEIREKIRECEGQHVQQAVFSTFMDTLTQICFTERKIRSIIEWEGARSWIP